MKNLLKSKRVWVITLVFLLFAAICYADYTMPDGTVVKWVSGNTLQVISPDGSSHITTGQRSENGRLVPVDNSVDRNVANYIPTQNSAKQGGMNNTNMTVPIVTNGQVSGWADVYGNGTAYQGNTAVRGSNESQGNTVDWNVLHNGYGGGVVNITTPGNTSITLPPSSGGGSNNNTYSPPYIPPAPYVTSVSVSGPNSATAAQSYSYTATATYSNGNTIDVTGSASWSNGSSFTPQSEGTFTVSATYAGVTGSKQVNVVLPPAAIPPDKPPVRLY